MRDLTEIELQRRAKLKEIQKLGIYPYGGRYSIDGAIERIKGDFSEKKSVSIAGRITAQREHGKSVFFDLKDSTGKIQLYARKDILGEKLYNFLRYLDIGDIVGVKGELFKTRTGEITIKILWITLLAKSLRPLPEKWHGLKDIETRYRQRYVDLIVNENVRKIFKTRTKIINFIRHFLNKKGFMEVDTPMMQPIPGGATGKPFKTHFDALDRELYLRIAPELYLKRLLVGGFEKVYEINKSFRNEGISPRHNPEFTMLEVYQAYSDCRGMMELVEAMVRELVSEIKGKEKFVYQGGEIDLSKWEIVSFAKLMEKNFGIRPEEDEKIWIKKLKEKGIKLESDKLSRTQIINIVGELIEPVAGNRPVFVVDIFKELCPLAKSKPDAPLLSDRFELYMGNLEVANAYSELNDPVEQRHRFEQAGGRIDEDFLRALEYGMPPAGGLGVGIDRLVMLFTDSANIREVILFPQLKEERQM